MPNLAADGSPVSIKIAMSTELVRALLLPCNQVKGRSEQQQQKSVTKKSN